MVLQGTYTQTIREELELAEEERVVKGLEEKIAEAVRIR